MGALRANVDLTILAKYITLEMSVDLNDPELTDLVLKRKAEYQLVSAGQNNLESLLHKALCSQKFLVIPVICEHAMTKRKHLCTKEGWKSSHQENKTNDSSRDWGPF